MSFATRLARLTLGRRGGGAGVTFADNFVVEVDQQMPDVTVDSGNVDVTVLANDIQVDVPGAVQEVTFLGVVDSLAPVNHIRFEEAPASSTVLDRVTNKSLNLEVGVNGNTFQYRQAGLAPQSTYAMGMATTSGLSVGVWVDPNADRFMHQVNLAGSPPFTIMCWFKGNIDGAAANRILWSNPSRFQVYVDTAGDLRVQYVNSLVQFKTISGTTGVFSSDASHSIAVVYEGASAGGQWRLYIDGVEDATFAADPEAVFTNGWADSTHHRTGIMNGVTPFTNAPCRGTMDELLTFNKALNGAQVNQIHTAKALTNAQAIAVEVSGG